MANKEFKTVENKIKNRKYQPFRELLLIDVLSDKGSRTPLLWALGTLIFGMFVYHWIEGWSFLDSIYFCVISLATVGYGDLAPTTSFGKLFTIVYVINGIAILLALFDRIRVVRMHQLEASPTGVDVSKPQTQD